MQTKVTSISRDNLRAAISDFMMSRALFARDVTIEDIVLDVPDIIPLTITYSKEGVQLIKHNG